MGKSVSVQYNLWSRLAPLLVETRVRPLTFLYEIYCSRTFIWSIFWYNVYFWQLWSLKWIYLPTSEWYHLKHINHSTLWLHSWGKWTCAPVDFFVWNSILNNFYLNNFFHIIGNFGSVQPDHEFTFLFQYNILFVTYQSFESLSSTPRGDRHVRPLIFLYEIQCSTTFIWTIFLCNW